MDGVDIIFVSFGLYILGLVLLFGSYDIFLRIRHGQKQSGKIRLVLSLLFLLTMGLILFIFSLLLLARLWAGSKILFYSGVIIFLAVAGGTFQIMKWKRQVVSEDRDMDAGPGAGSKMSEKTCGRSKGK